MRKVTGNLESHEDLTESQSSTVPEDLSTKPGLYVFLAMSSTRWTQLQIEEKYVQYFSFQYLC